MKKLSPRYKNWLAVRQESEEKRSIYRRNNTHFVQIEHARGKLISRASMTRSMPSVLCFDNNPAETISTLAVLRQRLAAIRPRRRTSRPSKHNKARSRWAGRYSSFETIQKISPATALVIAAEYETRYIKTNFTPYIVNVSQWNSDVFNSLKEVGFFDKVGIPQYKPDNDPDGDTLILPMRSGMTADPSSVHTLIEDLKKIYPGYSEDAKGGLMYLYGAMLEAVVNVVRHAYSENAIVGPPTQANAINRWWMTGAVNRADRRMTAVVYDRGMTIPVSLADWEKYAGWRRRIFSMLGFFPGPRDTKSDGEAIAAAVEESVSSTGDAHRGHGLAQMRDFVDQCRDGHLRILSRCGEVVFRTGGQREVRTYDASIGGTLIEWSVLL